MARWMNVYIPEARGRRAWNSPLSTLFVPSSASGGNTPRKTVELCATSSSTAGDRERASCSARDRGNPPQGGGNPNPGGIWPNPIPANPAILKEADGRPCSSHRGPRLVFLGIQDERVLKPHPGVTGTSRPESTCKFGLSGTCLLYTSPSPRDGLLSRMPSSA